VQLAKLEKRTQLQMANITGLSVRQIRRIRNGE
jgi:transcriptional regulator with XRE-family HTH domain